MISVVRLAEAVVVSQQLPRSPTVITVTLAQQHYLHLQSAMSSTLRVLQEGWMQDLRQGHSAQISSAVASVKLPSPGGARPSNSGCFSPFLSYFSKVSSDRTTAWSLSRKQSLPQVLCETCPWSLQILHLLIVGRKPSNLSHEALSWRQCRTPPTDLGQDQLQTVLSPETFNTPCRLTFSSLR